VTPQSGSSAAAVTRVRDKFGVSQRRRYRYEVHNLTYVNIEENNGGVIRNLNESGLCVQSVSPLEKGQQVRLRFELLNPRIRVGTTAKVCWVTASGLAGLEFSGLNARSTQLIKDWLLTQLLLRGQRLFVTNSVFASPSLDSHVGVQPNGAAVLNVVDAPIPDQQILLSGLDESDQDAARGELWALAVDLAAIVTAVLLFSVIATAMMKSLPNWLICAAVTALTAAILTGLYWALFTTCTGATPGNYLAQRVFGMNEKTGSRREERDRFR
jgi:hypothetical protein